MVKWRDTLAKDGWVRGTGLDTFMNTDGTVPQVGFLLGEDKDYISLTSGFGVGHLLNVFKIPKGCISRRRKLGTVKIKKEYVDGLLHDRWRP